MTRTAAPALRAAMRSAEACRRHRGEHHTGLLPRPFSGTSNVSLQRGQIRTESVRASKTAGSAPTLSPFLNYVRTYCYPSVTLVQEV